MKYLMFYYLIWDNLFETSSFPREHNISNMPGPNFDPVRHILRGCPIPLKFVLLFFIILSIIGSSVSLLKSESLFISSLNNLIILIAASSKSFLSSLLIWILSFIKNFEFL